MEVFNIGDKVISITPNGAPSYLVGMTGTVVELCVEPEEDGFHYGVKFDSEPYTWYCSPEKLKPLKGKTEMSNVEELQKQIEQTQKTLQMLQEKLKAEENAWKSSGGEYFIDGGFQVFGPGPSAKHTREAGLEYSTKQDAEKAAKALKKYALLYKLAHELNQGWEPNWESGRENYILEVDHNGEAEIITDHYRTYETFCGVYFKDRITALRAIVIINNGGLE